MGLVAVEITGDWQKSLKIQKRQQNISVARLRFAQSAGGLKCNSISIMTTIHRWIVVNATFRENFAGYHSSVCFRWKRLLFASAERNDKCEHLSFSRIDLIAQPKRIAALQIPRRLRLSSCLCSCFFSWWLLETQLWHSHCLRRLAQHRCRLFTSNIHFCRKNCLRLYEIPR